MDTHVSAADLTVEEQASLTSGADFWTTKAVDRVGIPSIRLSDGPNGLRKQVGATDHLGIAGSVPATCFPPAVGLSASWDPELLERVGAAIAQEAVIEDIAIVLGPGINIKRSPLCGRNFEYFSEDPHVSGELGAAFIRGVQSRHVGSSLKHFAANNQETDRMRASSDVDPRPLREIYLRAFERVVKDAQPWTVMCAYNKINGVYASEDPWLLTTVLRDDWGFEGVVVSDWGAVNDRLAGVIAGLDLEMPSTGGHTDAALAAAVHDGTLDPRILEATAQRMIDLARKAEDRPAAEGELDVEAHHVLAREAAGRSIVLLRNEQQLLPLERGARIAVIGAFAEHPRFQGAGSSKINATRVDVPLDELRAMGGEAVSYAPGFPLEDSDGDDAPRSADELREEAVALARDAETTVVFLGLPASAESEGFDRETLDLPADQLALLDAVLETNPRTVVVLSNGGVVTLPFADRVPAILEAWLLGQGGGRAIADVLYGEVNPSGRLAETMPIRLEDTPAYGSFPGELGHVRYGEGVLVGYRWYDARDLDVAFPFGHGLSYTSFSYGDAAIEAGEGGGLVVSVDVTNTGDRDGREVVQAYVGIGDSIVERAPRELKAFASVEIAAGGTATVRLPIRREDLAYWDPRVDRWVVEGGEYAIEVGASSRDLRARATVHVDGDELTIPLTLASTVGDVLDHPVAGPIFAKKMSGVGGANLQKMLASFPIGRLEAFHVLPVTTKDIEELIATANGEGDHRG